MKVRLITAIIAAAVFIPILIFSHTWIFPCAMALASVLGCFEMISCVGQKKNLWLMIPMCVFAALAPIGVRYFSSYRPTPWSAYASSFNDFLMLAVCVAIVMAIYIFGVAVFANKTLPITDAAMVIAGCLYIISAFVAIVYLRDYVLHGNFVYLLIFFVAWMSDSFAYFTGRLFGKHKLIPAVSPKKTVEGAIGGVLAAVVGMLLFTWILDLAFGFQVHYGYALIYGIVGSLMSVFGDLCFSVIKRQTGIKDYGNLIPGHGGILDRFDSMSVVAPLTEALMILIPVVVK